ncbi:MAG: SsrA-binding protein SmpB [bacterium]
MSEEKNITLNRKARFEYLIEETFEAGIVLSGTEVKSLRGGLANLQDSYARIENGEIWLCQCHISPYEKGNRFNEDSKRKRKLLLHRSEIRRLTGKVQEKGLTMIPLRMYFRNGKAKVELALARGKKLYDKREAQAGKDARRQIERALRDQASSF